ncbi:hypothetical protein [Streptomyces sp. Isolate_219]|nr:hypothetical protein [Streptomyces sp. Isolate_219]
MAVNVVSEGWAKDDPRWEALNTIAGYYQSLPTPTQLVGEEQS